MSRLITTAAAAAAVIAAAAIIPAASAASPPPPAAAAARLASSGVLPLLGEPHAAPPASAGAATAAPVTAPLSPSQCQAQFGAPCYDAALLRRIYGTGTLPGIDGRGVTVALILPFADPVLRHDLDVFAAQAQLPAPDLHVITIGHPAAASPSDPEQASAQEEGELDAEMILAMAPRVRLDYIETQQDTAATPASFTIATTVLAHLTALRPAVDAVSFSYGWFEQNYLEAAGGNQAAAAATIRAQAAGIDAAVRHGITVISADGDTGSAGPTLAGAGVYPAPTVAFMASDPLVTAVSGTQITADDTGTRTAPDTVWSGNGTSGATGGGLSAIFGRPAYQDPYTSITGDHRGVGDVAMDASGQSRVWIYTSRYQLLPGQSPGWVRIAGTSVAAPLFTGIVALASQMAGHRLGAINPRLYAMAADPAANGIQPVTTGCNTDFGVPGYCAGDGAYSLPDGIGTVGTAALFVPALAGLTPGGH
jgi:subtilase family serine protease